MAKGSHVQSDLGIELSCLENNYWSAYTAYLVVVVVFILFVLLVVFHSACGAGSASRSSSSRHRVKGLDRQTIIIVIKWLLHLECLRYDSALLQPISIKR